MVRTPGGQARSGLLGFLGLWGIGGFRVWGLGARGFRGVIRVRVWGLGFRGSGVQGLGFRV